MCAPYVAGARGRPARVCRLPDSDGSRQARAPCAEAIASMTANEAEPPLSARHVRHVMQLSQAGAVRRRRRLPSLLSSHHPPPTSAAAICRPCAAQTKRIESDAVEAVQACSSEFLSLIATEARVKVRREGRSEVNESDMLWALQALGFKPFADALRGHLHQHYTVRGTGNQPKAPPGAPGVKPAKRPRPITGPPGRCLTPVPNPDPNPDPDPDPNPCPDPHPKPTPQLQPSPSP